MRSMTGFGRAEIERGKMRVAAEVRTLNQRFFELKLNLPREPGASTKRKSASWSKALSPAAASRLFVRCIAAWAAPHDSARQRSPGDAVRQGTRAGSGEALGLTGKPGIEVLLHRPEIFQVSEEETDSRPGVQLAFTAITRALKALETDRKREGKALRADFIARINTITEAVPENRAAGGSFAQRNCSEFSDPRCTISRRHCRSTRSDYTRKPPTPPSTAISPRK